MFAPKHCKLLLLHKKKKNKKNEDILVAIFLPTPASVSSDLL